jgi:hypothetical protein
VKAAAVKAAAVEDREENSNRGERILAENMYNKNRGTSGEYCKQSRYIILA